MTNLNKSSNLKHHVRKLIYEHIGIAREKIYNNRLLQEDKSYWEMINM